MKIRSHATMPLQQKNAGVCKKHNEPYRMAGKYRICGKCKAESGQAGGNKKWEEKRKREPK